MKEIIKNIIKTYIEKNSYSLIEDINTFVREISILILNEIEPVLVDKIAKLLCDDINLCYTYRMFNDSYTNSYTEQLVIVPNQMYSQTEYKYIEHKSNGISLCQKQYNEILAKISDISIHSSLDINIYNFIVDYIIKKYLLAESDSYKYKIPHILFIEIANILGFSDTQNDTLQTLKYSDVQFKYNTVYGILTKSVSTKHKQLNSLRDWIYATNDSASRKAVDAKYFCKKDKYLEQETFTNVVNIFSYLVNDIFYSEGLTKSTMSFPNTLYFREELPPMLKIYLTYMNITKAEFFERRIKFIKRLREIYSEIDFESSLNTQNVKRIIYSENPINIANNIKGLIKSEYQINKEFHQLLNNILDYEEYIATLNTENKEYYTRERITTSTRISSTLRSLLSEYQDSILIDYTTKDTENNTNQVSNLTIPSHLTIKEIQNIQSFSINMELVNLYFKHSIINNKIISDIYKSIIDDNLLYINASIYKYRSARELNVTVNNIHTSVIMNDLHQKVNKSKEEYVIIDRSASIGLQLIGR